MARKRKSIKQKMANLVWKLEKFVIFETNWTDLPAEMRRMCIERMDFKTRASLRVTSKFEKSLVDSTKLYLRYFGWKMSPQELRIEKTAVPVGKLSERAFVDLLASFFKRIAFVDEIFIEACECAVRVEPLLLAELQKCEPIGFASFYANSSPCVDVQLHLIRTCATFLRRVRIDQLSEENTHKPFMAIPQFVNAKFIQTTPGSSESALSFIVDITQKWIDNDEEIGRVAVCYMLDSTEGHEQFAQKFAHRIISRTDDERLGKMVRIGTNNHEKHIVFSQMTKSCEIVHRGEEYRMCRLTFRNA